MSTTTTSSLRISLFIPCYNVESTVIAVLKKIPVATLSRFEKVFLIDNCSKDLTVKKIEAFIDQDTTGKFILLKNQTNVMLGGSNIVAFRESILAGFDFLICMHSDGQADPADLEKFFPLDTSEDFVFGSRMLADSKTSEYSFLRKAGNYAFALLQQIILRQKIYDIGAFIAFNLKTVASLPYSKIPADMAYQPNLILYAATKRRLKCREFPIYWGAAEHSNVNIWAYGMTHLRRLMSFMTGTFKLTQKNPEDFLSTPYQSDASINEHTSHNQA